MIPISKPFISDAEKHAVLEVLESGMLVQGTRVARLEEMFAGVCGTRYAIATSNGTAALYLALLAHDIGPGDEVITSPFTFIASVNSIIYTGARPVFVDIDPDTFNINPQLIERAITSATRVILPVHLYGMPCDMEAIMSIAETYNLSVIEDCAQAIGATYQGRPVGSFGTGCFSLYATKNVTSGEGGMITTNDESVADYCRLARSHGMRRRYHHEMLGYNFRLSDLHAAIGVAQMERLAELTARRRANAAFLSSSLKTVVTPQSKEGYEHVWHQYTIRVDRGRDRDAMTAFLSTAGIGTGVFYPIPAHQQPHIREMVGELSFPVAEEFARQVISLPVHPQLADQDVDYIVSVVNRL